MLGVRIATPFPRLTYDDAMRRYGSDKPDTRYGMELADLTEAFRGSGFQSFANVVADGGVVKGFAAPGSGRLVAQGARRSGAGGEVARRGRAGVGGRAARRRSSRRWRSSCPRARSPRSGSRTGAGEGDLVLLVADREKRANVVLDGLRRHMADRLGLVPEGRWDFLWVTEFPVFEWNEDDGSGTRSTTRSRRRCRTTSTPRRRARARTTAC